MPPRPDSRLMHPDSPSPDEGLLCCESGNQTHRTEAFTYQRYLIYGIVKVFQTALKENISLIYSKASICFSKLPDCSVMR